MKILDVVQMDLEERGNRLVVAYEEIEKLKQENEKLRVIVNCSYIHGNTIDHSFICDKCGYVESEWKKQ